MGHFQCLGAPWWAYAPPFYFKIEVLKTHNKHSADKAWTKVYCHFHFRWITLNREMCGSRKYPYSPQGGLGKISRGKVESQEPSFFKGKGKSKMEFPEGSGVKQINKY